MCLFEWIECHVCTHVIKSNVGEVTNTLYAYHLYFNSFNDIAGITFGFVLLIATVVALGILSICYRNNLAFINNTGVLF